jgi:hypothetical protein
VIVRSHFDPAWLGRIAAGAGGGGGEPASPLTVSGIWAFHRSDTGLSNDGSNVTGTTNCWADQTGNSHGLNSAASQQPGYTASGPNSKPAVVFTDSTNKFLDSNLTGANLTAQPFGFFVLIKPTNWRNNAYFWDTNQNLVKGAMIQSGSTPDVAPFAGSFGTAIAVPLNTWQILTAIYNGASSVLQTNNNAEVSTNPGTNGAAGGILLGNFDTSGSNSAGFQVAAIIIHNGLPDASARTVYKDWLAWYGGLSI